MLIPIRWFREYVAFDLDVPQLAERLTMAGLEVEEIHETEGDTVLDIYVTPNRGDCLSLMGVAREVAAITGGAGRGAQSEAPGGWAPGASPRGRGREPRPRSPFCLPGVPGGEGGRVPGPPP